VIAAHVGQTFCDNPRARITTPGAASLSPELRSRNGGKSSFSCPSYRRISVRRAVCLVRSRLLDDRDLDRIGWRPPLRHASRPRHAVKGLAADLRNTRHRRERVAIGDEITRAGDALISLPLPQEFFPASSKSSVLRPRARSSSTTLRRSSRSPWRSSCRPGPGQPLRGFAPPRLSGEPKDSGCQHGPGSEPPLHSRKRGLPVHVLRHVRVDLPSRSSTSRPCKAPRRPGQTPAA